MELDPAQKRQASLLHEWRTHRGMSLQDVATALPGNLTKQAISLWENELRRMPPFVHESLPKVFGVSSVTYARGPRS